MLINNEDILKIVKLVDDLNLDWYELTDEEDYIPFTFSTNGCDCEINFINTPIWSSEFNDIEENDPFEIELKKHLIKEVTTLNTKTSEFLKGIKNED